LDAVKDVALAESRPFSSHAVSGNVRSTPETLKQGIAEYDATLTSRVAARRKLMMEAEGAETLRRDVGQVLSGCGAWGSIGGRSVDRDRGLLDCLTPAYGKKTSDGKTEFLLTKK
jgi:hypothetical protein